MQNDNTSTITVSSQTQQKVRLTQFSHGGGCGCKISPALLSDILSSMPQMAAFPNLLVGLESSDDAAVYKLNDRGPGTHS